MRQLTDSKRKAMEQAWKIHLEDDPEMASFIPFEAGFTAGLDYSADRIAALETQLRAESAENGRLKAALRPFARIAGLPGFPKGINVTLWERATNVEGQEGIAITLADCIEARRALGEGSDG